MDETGRKRFAATGTTLATTFFVVHPERRSTTNPDEASRAFRDEWGIYDPEQAGVEAVLRRVAAKRAAAAVAPARTLAVAK